jgi:hypothetical protein
MTAAIRNARALASSRARTAEKGVYARVKQVEPPPKLPVAECNSAGELTMDGQRIATESGDAEQHALPEVVHLRQMRHPVRVGNVIEDRTQEVVATHMLVEIADEALDVSAGGNVCDR